MNKNVNELVVNNSFPHSYYKTLKYTSLCIPRINSEITMEYVHSVFMKWNIGHVCNIKEFPLRSDPKNKRIIVKMLCEPTNDTKLKELFKKHETIKLVYDFPHFWKISPTIIKHNFTV